MCKAATGARYARILCTRAVVEEYILFHISAHIVLDKCILLGVAASLVDPKYTAQLYVKVVHFPFRLYEQIIHLMPCAVLPTVPTVVLFVFFLALLFL